jgi:DNA-binding phage protein
LPALKQVHKAMLMLQKRNLTLMKKEQFSPYRVADYLTTPSEITAYLKAAKEENDPELLAAAIEDIRQIELERASSKEPNPLRG